MADIIERLNEACNGHPHAKIPWPHRLLHDARDEIERLRFECLVWEYVAEGYPEHNARMLAKERMEERQ